MSYPDKADVCRHLGVQPTMDVRSLSARQLHALDVATHGQFLAVLTQHMVAGPFADADVDVAFEGRGFRVDVVFGTGCDGHRGEMVTFVVGEALTDTTRLAMLIIHVECLQRSMADRLRRSEARAAKASEARGCRSA